MFPERIGCFSVESKRILEYQEPPLEIVKECSSLAGSHGLKVFAVRNGNKCLGDMHLLSTLPRLNSARGCLGGRGGQNVSDVYRLTSKKTLPSMLQKTFIPFLSFLQLSISFLSSSLDYSYIHLSIHCSISLIHSFSNKFGFSLQFMLISMSYLKPYLAIIECRKKSKIALTFLRPALIGPNKTLAPP